MSVQDDIRRTQQRRRQMAPVPPPPPPEPDPVETRLAAIQQVLEALVAQPPPVPPQMPSIVIEPPDLSPIISAIKGLRAGASPDEIGKAISRYLPPAAEQPDFEKLTQAIKSNVQYSYPVAGGGGTVGLRAKAIADLAAALNPVALDTATLAALETVELGSTTLAALETITVVPSGQTFIVNPGTGTGYFRTREFSATSTRSSVLGSAVSQTLLAANTGRLGLTLFNDATTILRIAFGVVTVSVANFDNKIPVNGYFEVPFGWTGAISGIWDGVPVGSLFMAELT